MTEHATTVSATSRFGLAAPTPAAELMRMRHDICLRKAHGDPPPWTDDPVLQRYSFCNVYREFDRQTLWIDDNIRRPHADHPHCGSCSRSPASAALRRRSLS
jgi:hypothetical protein